MDKELDMFRFPMASLLVALVMCSFGCTREPDPPVVATPVNQTCPIMGGKVTPEGGSAAWNEQLIGFCCDSCIPDWNALSDEEKAEKLAAANR